jgi:hypothetical protein
MCLGKHPEWQILEGSHTASLAQEFGRELRNLVAKDEYRAIFPDLHLARDSRAAGRWNTAEGSYFAVGTWGALAGRGANLAIIDDPHSEQDVLENSKAAFERAWNWYLSGPRQRMQPDGAILVCMTRWGALDLTGRLLKQALEDDDGEVWEVIEFPPSCRPAGHCFRNIGRSNSCCAPKTGCR